MNRIKSKLAALAALCLFCGVAQAQEPRLYMIGWLDGGTNCIPGLSTNATGWAFPMSEHDVASVQFSLQGMDAVTGNVAFRAFESADGVDYTTAPTRSLLLGLNGTNVVCGKWELTNYTATVKIVAVNTNTVPLTNVNGRVRFFAPQRTFVSW